MTKTVFLNNLTTCFTILYSGTFLFMSCNLWVIFLVYFRNSRGARQSNSNCQTWPGWGRGQFYMRNDGLLQSKLRSLFHVAVYNSASDNSKGVYRDSNLTLIVAYDILIESTFIPALRRKWLFPRCKSGKVNSSCLCKCSACQLPNRHTSNCSAVLRKHATYKIIPKQHTFSTKCILRMKMFRCPLSWTLKVSTVKGFDPENIIVNITALGLWQSCPRRGKWSYPTSVSVTTQTWPCSQGENYWQS